MATRIEAGWDVERTGAFAIEVTEDPSGTPATWEARITEGTYCHTNISSVTIEHWGVGSYTEWFTAVGAALAAESAASGKGWLYVVEYDKDQLEYTISARNIFGTIQTISLNWVTSTTAEGSRMRASMGFTGFTNPAAQFHSGTVRPYYILTSEIGAPSNVSGPYRRDGRSRGSIAMDGRHYAIQTGGTPTLEDFSWHFESLARTFGEEASASFPWTYEDFVEHCGAIEPFMHVDHTGKRTVHVLRPEGDRFQPERVAPDWDELWNWRFETYREGRLTDEAVTGESYQVITQNSDQVITQAGNDEITQTI